jgi:lipid-binding SYLF domain-containing protein
MVAAIAALALGVGAGGVAAQDNSSKMQPNSNATNPSTTTQPDARMSASRDDRQDATAHVEKSVAVAKNMERDPKLKKLLQDSKGVFLVPDYVRAALGVGGQGGAGVLLRHEGGKWTGPGFYNIGGVSIGAQAGIATGQIALILMDDKAINSFKQNNKFSLNAEAGLTIVNYSADAIGEAGRGDVVLWTNAKGAFANLAVSVTDIHFDSQETRAYYGRAITPQQVASGAVTNDKASALLRTLPA